jgi:hypothetical protein
MTLVNEGAIIATGTHALDIDTGTNVVVNTGTLEATGSGGLVIHGDVANSGLLWANGGNVTIAGAVSGSGSAIIDGTATLQLGAPSSMQTTFGQDAAGTLRLDDSLDFSGVVSGFGQNDHLDLSDIKFGAGMTHDYLPNAQGTGGTLTVSDGAHTANITMVGQYTAEGFHVSDDHHAGTQITYGWLIV